MMPHKASKTKTPILRLSAKPIEAAVVVGYAIAIKKPIVINDRLFYIVMP